MPLRFSGEVCYEVWKSFQEVSIVLTFNIHFDWDLPLRRWVKKKVESNLRGNILKGLAKSSKHARRSSEPVGRVNTPAKVNSLSLKHLKAKVLLRQYAHNVQEEFCLLPEKTFDIEESFNYQNDYVCAESLSFGFRNNLMGSQV
ncbi:hypothetical protein TNCV_4247151 [Trichonephila clavipes]|nr:hypothetical protein TNCV_4247151 [Trichonephila clavipes]